MLLCSLNEVAAHFGCSRPPHHSWPAFNISIAHLSDIAARTYRLPNSLTDLQTYYYWGPHIPPSICSLTTLDGSSHNSTSPHHCCWIAALAVLASPLIVSICHTPLYISSSTSILSTILSISAR